jgi:hypothetical protein
MESRIERERLEGERKERPEEERKERRKEGSVRGSEEKGRATLSV